MVWSVLPEGTLSPRSSPLWIRLAAAGLALFASWWMWHTAMVRNLGGSAVAALSLGVVAVFVLRGTHQPLGLWPGRFARKRFWLPVAVAMPIVFAALIALGGASDAVSDVARAVVTENRGAVVLVIAGGIAWAFGVGLVRQRPYATWYGTALLCAAVPVMAGWLTGWDPVPGQTEGGVTVGIAGLVFWGAAETARVLVSEELAFRRMLIGAPERGGVLLIVGAAVVAAAWVPVVFGDAPLLSPVVFHGFLVAIVSGGLYVLSRSLMVAALYHGIYLAALVSFTIGMVDGRLLYAPAAPTASIIATAVIAASVSAVVGRRCGWIGQLVEEQSHAAGD